MSEEEVIIGVCGECKSDQNSSRLERNPFYLANQPAPCQYCGGIVLICDAKDREQVLRQFDMQRKIGQG